MLKKILLTLFILIVLLVAGVVALIVFVDPNNFRGFISDKVKEQTGYELTIQGDLRWHIWPQISILTDSVRLEDEGAKKPILTADNMRLDVELMPLFSKELVVKNVLVKAAVINVTDESKGNVAKGNKTTTTVNQTQSQTNNETDKSGSGWSFALNQLEIADSTVVYQQNKDLISFRDINITLLKKEDNNVALDVKGSINRDQQNFIYALNADINLANFPQKAQVALHKFSYDYTGVGVPSGELKGDIKATFDYQQTPLVLDSKDFHLTLNGNVIDGQLMANLDKKPYFEALLKSDKFDLTPFLATSSDDKSNSTTSSSQSQPVITKQTKQGNELAFLQSFNAKFNLTVNEVVAKNLVINNFILDANNQDGVAKLNKVNLDIANGNVTANGSANGKQPVTAIALDTNISNIDLGTLFTQLEFVKNFSGKFNAQGHIATNTIDPDNIMSSLTGDLAVTVNNAKFENFNVQNIIQTAVSQYSKEPVTADEYQKYTELHEISANAKLASGDMNLSSIKALSSTLDIVGSGRVGLVKNDLDLNLNVQILSGWNGESKTIQKLQQVVIPLRIYGSFAEIHYRVDAEKIVKDLLGNQLQNSIDKLKERLGGQSNTEESTEQKDSSDTSDGKIKAKDILGGLINKIK
ncbi:outer membrane assembly protein AsmA [Orbus mooreae]|uniref:outer membrane assembly protein AsmA n=1 Tax=Orbus mooreae TaxID=3074107 RepID=UPI00370D3554